MLLILKYFGPELKYIKGENKVVADDLSRLEMSKNEEILNISEIYGYDDADLPDCDYTIRYHDISKAWKTDAKLKQKLVSHKEYTLDTFRGGNLKKLFNIPKKTNMLTCGTTKENYIFVSRYAL